MSAHVFDAEILPRDESQRVLRLHIKDDLHVDFIVSVAVAWRLAERIVTDTGAAGDE
jgi:hypothetical protein